jgi:hypothetical protein
MSRGPGRWQRMLLAELDQNEVVPVREVIFTHLGRTPTRAEEVACRRAAHQLALSGQVRVVTGFCHNKHGHEIGVLTVTRPDSTYGPPGKN